MNIEDCFYLGYISKAIGNKGELAFKLDVDSPSSYKKISSVLIQNHKQDKSLIPFLIDSPQLQNNGLLRCRLEGVGNLQEAKNLVGKSLYLSLSELPELNGNQFYYHEIINYMVIDKLHGELGKIREVYDLGKSNLIAVDKDDKEILIPIQDETIIKVDKEAQQLFVNCPDGLIDLYLER